MLFRCTICGTHLARRLVTRPPARCPRYRNDRSIKGIALKFDGSQDTQLCLTYWCRRFRSLCARVATGVWARSSSYT